MLFVCPPSANSLPPREQHARIKRVTGLDFIARSYTPSGEHVSIQTWEKALFACLDTMSTCTAGSSTSSSPVGQRLSSSSSSSPSLLVHPSLKFLNVDFDINSMPGDFMSTVPIVGSLATNPRYATAFGPSLKTLIIANSHYDEGSDNRGNAAAALGRFASVFTYLEDLQWIFGRKISSLRGTANSCSYASLGTSLRKLVITRANTLQSLDGLETLECLEHLTITEAPHIKNLDPLRFCTSLRTLILFCCQQLASIAALGSHQPSRLEFLELSFSSVTSIQPLRSCRALQVVDLFANEMLESLDGLQGLPVLEKVIASRTPITSVLPLKDCPRLRKVFLRSCDSLKSLEGVAKRKHLVVKTAEKRRSSYEDDDGYWEEDGDLPDVDYD